MRQRPHAPNYVEAMQTCSNTAVHAAEEQRIATASSRNQQQGRKGKAHPQAQLNISKTTETQQHGAERQYAATNAARPQKNTMGAVNGSRGAANSTRSSSPHPQTEASWQQHAPQPAASCKLQHGCINRNRNAANATGHNKRQQGSSQEEPSAAGNHIVNKALRCYSCIPGPAGCAKRLEPAARKGVAC